MYTENFEKLEERIAKAVERISKLKEEKDELARANLELTNRVTELENAPTADPVEIEELKRKVENLAAENSSLKSQIEESGSVLLQQEETMKKKLTDMLEKLDQLEA